MDFPIHDKFVGIGDDGFIAIAERYHMMTFSPLGIRLPCNSTSEVVVLRISGSASASG